MKTLTPKRSRRSAPRWMRRSCARRRSSRSQMVLLTIAISGGPFLGLLGTVVGVMITFAAIAASGDVNVNAIAPGIAAALVATVPAWPSRSRRSSATTASARGSRRSTPTCTCSSTSSSRASPSLPLTPERRVHMPPKKKTLRRDQHHADARSRVRAAGDLHHHDDGVGAGHHGQPAEGERDAGIAKPKTKAITITADGTIYLDTYPVTIAELERLLHQYKAADPTCR